MLHHISIAVNEPQHVAEVLAEVLPGRVVPFPPHPGSYMVLAGDEYGTLIELYPMGTVAVPFANAGQVGFGSTEQPSGYTPFHAAISVPTSLEKIQQVGAREGWTVCPANRDGMFDVIEFWIENRLMLELLTPKMAATYMKLFEPESLEANLAQFASQFAEPATV